MACTALYFWTGPEPVYQEQEDPCAWEGELTPTQTKAATEIEKTITKSNEELLVWAVCGAGKTEMLFPGITTAIKQGKRICLATPRADVVRELLPRFQLAFPNTTTAALYGGVEDKQPDAQFIIATTHQLLRYAHAFDVIIIDEVDAFPFHADPSLPYVAERSAKPNATTIYLTATPRKALKNDPNNKNSELSLFPFAFMVSHYLFLNYNLLSRCKRHFKLTSYQVLFGNGSSNVRILLDKY
ncbi:hypothetical protein GCM10011351_21990 [Paraliobacillus quinghaiensis]|uniref:Helicase ATP-binding domain-containing protein n=1 Tax=Paraliobacillus quinghaiensis TaxID=470815 RepID=A0A917WWI5_9BACI|nr:DEAD/DEAH box helicase family protein [Paraliobacillus quinghaiensis]GGM35476.1 hypothetical protein GCM10011351_21990 [Paraliobacillus quinghaiensis]